MPGTVRLVAEEQSWATSPGVRRSMQGNRSRDTSPELAVRRAVHALGLRYRVATRPIPGLNRRADLVFGPTRVAVFVDGCYWHGCPNHFVLPKSNVDYWQPKISRNMTRDRDTDERLSEAGWVVFRAWEHDDPVLAAQAIEQIVKARRAGARGRRSGSTSASTPT